jgi:hypothetical protein
MAVDTNAQSPISLGTKFDFGATISGLGGTSSSISSTSGGKSDATQATVSAMGSPSPISVLIGIIVIGVLLKIIGESPDTKIEGHHVSLGAYNVGTILVVTIAGIAFLKLILNRFQLPGATDLINFI